MAKSADEGEFKKSLSYYLPNAWIWKPADVGGSLQSTGRSFEQGRPSDYLVQAVTTEGPLFALIELKRFEKRTLNHNDLRASQVEGLNAVHQAGGLSLVGFHCLSPNLTNRKLDLMYLIPYADVKVAGSVKVEKYLFCERTKIPAPTLGHMNKTVKGWDLKPLLDIMAAHAKRCRDPKFWSKFL